VRTTRPTCYIPLDSVMPIKLTTITNAQFHYTYFPVFLFFPSLDTDSTLGGVSAKPAIASLSLPPICLDSRVDTSQFCYMYIAKDFYPVMCARLVTILSYSAHFILHICHRSRLPSNTYIELWETDFSLTTGDFTENLLVRLT
jgi:hypothetical protein